MRGTVEANESNNGQQSDFPPGLSAPARRALLGAGIEQLVQLSAISEAELMRLHGIGPNTVNKLRAALADADLAFAGENGKLDWDTARHAPTP